MYNEYAKYTTRMTEIYQEYAKSSERMTDLYKELAMNADKMTKLYKETAESTEKMSKYWLNYISWMKPLSEKRSRRKTRIRKEYQKPHKGGPKIVSIMVYKPLTPLEVENHVLI